METNSRGYFSVSFTKHTQLGGKQLTDHGFYQGHKRRVWFQPDKKILISERILKLQKGLDIS